MAIINNEPPITLAQFDQIINNMCEEDKKYYTQFRAVYLPIVTQKLIEIMRNKQNKTFDQFMNDALAFYITHLINEQRKRSQSI